MLNSMDYQNIRKKIRDRKRNRLKNKKIIRKKINDELYKIIKKGYWKLLRNIITQRKLKNK